VVEFPICAFTNCRDVVVRRWSNAGGFGILGAVRAIAERLETTLSWIDGNRPGVSLRRPTCCCPPKYVGAERGGIGHDRTCRASLLREHRAFVDSCWFALRHIGGQPNEERLARPVT